MNLQDRIKQLFLEHPDKSAAQLSRAIKVSKPSISDWLSGNTKTINAENAIKVGKFFGVNFEWVATGKGKKDINEKLANYKISPIENIKPGQELQGRVPLINLIQAGKWQAISESDNIETLETWLLTTAKVSNQAFALRVVGDSMTNPHGAPSIPDGYIVIVDPAIQPVNGSIVVAILEDSKEATLKKLVIDGSKQYLKPLNPAYPAIEITGNCTICGIVKKVEYDL